MPVSGNVSPTLFALARMTVSSTGTGDITLNTNVTGFLTFDLAGCSTASTGQPLVYAINDIPINSATEIGSGVYFSSSKIVQRGSSTFGLKSTNGNSPIAMSSQAQVAITPAAYTYQRPTVQTFSTASGSSGTGTYTTPNNVTYIRVRQVGGGGGGSGSGTAAGTAASSGGTTTFGTSSLLFTAGGSQGVFGSPSAFGGTVTLASCAIGFAAVGSQGPGGGNGAIAGGNGGPSPFGGAGGGGLDTNGGGNAAANSGSGGGGGGGIAAGTCGGGGASGGYIDAIITSPSATYAYAIGAAGGGGGAGTGAGAAAGGNGGSGFIVVEEHYGS